MLNDAPALISAAAGFGATPAARASTMMMMMTMTRMRGGTG